MKKLTAVWMILALVLAMSAVPAYGEGQPAAEPIPAESEAFDIQYVLYLGTNDKDTNKPVFTQAEAMEQLKAILIRNFGGYTIQEAHGGWISDGKEYQEYTLVIYLSDVTEEKMYEVAEELRVAFNQSAVLILGDEVVLSDYFMGN